MQKQERSTIYPHICDGNIRLGRFQEVVNAANEGIRYCYSEPTKAGLYGYKAIGHFMTGDYANFKKSYQEYFKRLNTVPIIATEYLILLNSLYAISNQDSVKYQEYKNKLSGLLRKYSSYAYYSYNGQYDKAAKVMNKINYTFSGWFINGTQNRVSSAPTYKFTVNDQTDLIARFNESTPGGGGGYEG